MKIKSVHFKKDFDLHKAELIGEGNFAQVYRVFDPDLKDSIAIRKVKKALADPDDIAKEKHINEELRKVDNENILKIYDIIEQADTVWYITEYCAGGSLWDALNLCKDNKMKEKDALECVLQVSKGVQELHNHRITHRDLKPQNILLKTKYVVGKPLPMIKLADFGLSTQKIIMETIAGTKEYIAPEQAKFHNYTNAVDVWSLGIIFDEILHGTPFYCGEDNKEVFNKILKMPYKVRDETIRQSIRELLLSLLKKKPYERPIIAVIRSTVQKILEEVQEEKTSKLAIESQSDKQKKSKSSNQIPHNVEIPKNSSGAKLHSNNSKDSAPVQSRKIYESGTLEREEQKPEKVEKTWKSHLVLDQTPKNKPNVGKDLSNFAKNQSTNTPKAVEPKPELKEKVAPAREKVPLAKSRSVVDELFPPPSGKREDKGNPDPNQKDKSTQKEEKSSQKQEKSSQKEEKASQKQEKSSQKQGINSPKGDGGSKIVSVAVIHDKISVYRSQKKKVANSSIKKQEYKSEITDLNAYKDKIYSRKSLLSDFSFREQKITAFLPNSHLVCSQPQGGTSEQAFADFKKKMGYLNYFNSSEDYEIRLCKGTNELLVGKQVCLKQLQGIQDNLKKMFLEQIDKYVDQFVDKVLK